MCLGVSIRLVDKRWYALGGAADAGDSGRGLTELVSSKGIRSKDDNHLYGGDHHEGAKKPCVPICISPPSHSPRPRCQLLRQEQQ